MPQVDSFMSIFSSVFGLVSSIIFLGAMVLVIVTCFKVIGYVNMKKGQKMLK